MFIYKPKLIVIVLFTHFSFAVSKFQWIFSTNTSGAHRKALFLDREFLAIQGSLQPLQYPLHSVSFGEFWSFFCEFLILSRDIFIISSFKPKFENQFFVDFYFTSFKTWNCSASVSNRNKNNFMFTICTKGINQQELVIKFWFHWRNYISAWYSFSFIKSNLAKNRWRILNLCLHLN